MQSSVNLGIWRDSKWSEQAWTDPALEKKHINNILPLKWCLACIEHCVLWQNVLLKLQEPFSVCQDIFKCLYAFIIIFWEWGGLWGRVTLMMLTEDSGLGSSVSKNCNMYWKCDNRNKWCLLEKLWNLEPTKSEEAHFNSEIASPYVLELNFLWY